MENYERIYKELISEESGLWFISDNFGTKIILKLQSSIIKAIINKCRIDFLFGREIKNFITYFHNCIRIYDDAINYSQISGPQIYLEDHKALKDVMEREEIAIEFYNELDICVGGTTIKFSEDTRIQVKTFLGNIENLFVGNYNIEVEESLNNFEFSINQERIIPNTNVIETINIQGELGEFKIMNINVIGDNENFLIQINEANEGELQERLAWTSLSSLFGSNLFKGAVIKNNDSYREFTDVFSFGSEEVFLIESKCLSLFQDNNDKNMEKKISRIQKHVQKAINQLVGASKAIKKSESIFTKESKDKINYGNKINFIHCIILVSDLYPLGDWDIIVNKIIDTMETENILLSLLDLKELIKLVKYSRGDVKKFEYLLVQRCEILYNTRNPLINFRLGK